MQLNYEQVHDMTGEIRPILQKVTGTMKTIFRFSPFLPGYNEISTENVPKAHF